jgi:hypothetical protein
VLFDDVCLEAPKDRSHRHEVVAVLVAAVGLALSACVCDLGLEMG